MNGKDWKDKQFNDEKIKEYTDKCVMTESNYVSTSHDCNAMFQEIQRYFRSVNTNRTDKNKYMLKHKSSETI
jgi:hypothetical protein